MNKLQKLREARELAQQLMSQHGLYDWSFGFNNRKSAFGLCSYRLKTISLSAQLVPTMPEHGIRNTILHEIAHALVGAGHGHDRVWKRKAREIGCDANRCSHYQEVNVRYKYIATCPCCNKEIGANRRPKRSHWCKCTARTFRPEDKLIYIQQY